LDRALLTQRARAALASFDLAIITTIHGFCQRVLSEFAFEAGMPLDVTLSAEADEAVARASLDLWEATLLAQPPAIVAWLQRAVNEREVRTVVAAATSPAGIEVRVGPPVAAEGALQAWWAAWDALGGALDEGAEQAIRSIPGHPSLNQVSYGGRSLGKLRLAAERICAARAARGEDAPLDDDLVDVLRRFSASALADKVKKGLEPPDHPVFGAVERAFGAASAALGALVGLRRTLLGVVAARARAQIDAVRPSAGTLFFDDLLERMQVAVETRPALREALRARFRAWLVDEFQDTDPCQARIFLGLCPPEVADAPPPHGALLVMVGDPKQAIYRFRGADLDAYLEACARDGVRRGTLVTNRRSDRPLLDGLAWMFSRVPHPFGDPRIGFAPPDPHHAVRVSGLPSPGAPIVLCMPGEAAEDEGGEEGEVEEGGETAVSAEARIAHDVLRWLRAGVRVGDRPLAPSDVAVLARARAPLHAVAAELRRWGVLAVVQGQDSVLAAPEAGELLAWMAAMLAPSQLDRARRLRFSPLFGDDGPALVALDEDPDALDAWVETVSGWSKTWRERGFMRSFQDLLRRGGVSQRLLAQPGGERALTNLRHLAELLHRVEREDKLGPASLHRWLADAHAEGTAGLPDVEETRLESDRQAVRLMTIHASKGLQFPVVFVHGLMGAPRADAPPRVSMGGRRILDLTEDGEIAARAQREVEEEAARLAYVALTRAEHALVIQVAIPKRLAGEGTLARLWGVGGSKAKPEDVRAAIVAAVAGAPAGCVAIDASPDPGALPWRAPTDLAAARAASTPARRFAFDRRITSFSGILRVVSDDDAGRDVDAHAVAVVAPEPVATPEDRATWADFPRGANAGSAVHAVLEQVPLATLAAPGADAAVEAVVARFGLTMPDGAGSVTATLTRGLADVVRTPLGPGEPALADLPVADQRPEIGFTLVAGRGAPGGGPRDTGAALVEAFRAHADPELVTAYAGRLARLPIDLVDASLKGFIDLVARYDGRYWVLDYKTNHLGDRAADYHRARLLEAMVHGDYLLQATLYVVAVHRLLRARLSGYDYDQHMGGVRYAFVRGMRPDRPGSGVFGYRPSRAWIEAWDHILGGAP
jgi:exodeoxyribonuclease V beta subunit